MNKSSVDKGRPSRRDDFPSAIKQVLGRRAGYRCSNPFCGTLTVGPGLSEGSTISIGVAAHIAAAAPRGPRYDASMTVDERRNIKNAIWLCQGCAKRVDSDGPGYSVDALVGWKQGREKWAELELGTSAGAAPRPGWITVSRLPPTSARVFGRTRLFRTFDSIWQSGSANVVCITADAGSGKTALVNGWLARMAKRGFDGAVRVFAWSFYSQGARTSFGEPELFIETALRQFGDPTPTLGTAWEKGERLASLVREKRTLLILDGLEPLQFPPGPQEGKLKDRAVAALLVALASHNTGVCIVTSRVSVLDISTFAGHTAQQINLPPLTPSQGSALLKGMGIRSSDRGELCSVVRHLHGHPLCLTLLGSYLAEAHRGDIRRWREVRLLRGEGSFVNHARTLMEAYSRWLADGNELQVLRLLGFFDKPADRPSLEALRLDPPLDHTFTEALADAAAWQQAVSRLRRLGLIAETYAHDPHALDTHPLVREFFADKLRNESPVAWREGNLRLYHLLTSTSDAYPETLEGMAPLYAAVGHGREAGHGEEALRDVFNDRIHRGTKYYAFRKLGSAPYDLACLSGFFASPWRTFKPGLDDRREARVLNQVGAMLRSVGRTREAIEATREALARRVRNEEWDDAALNATNLSELQMLVADFDAAETTAESSILFADRSQVTLWMASARATRACVAHQRSDTRTAARLFSEAESLQSEGGGKELLYSLRGYQYCDFLLEQGNPDDVMRRATTTLSWAEKSESQLDCGFSHLMLAFGAVVLGRRDAVDHALRAIRSFRMAESLHHVTRAHIALTAAHMLTPNLVGARQANDIALRYSESGDFVMYRADALLQETKLALMSGDPRASECLREASGLIRGSQYARRIQNLGDLEKEVGSSGSPSETIGK